ncbi:MAG: hypothetical protein JJE39_02340 [Vicinamibacteria bacterium]|nr:hypothetical protein [Vicinamibacteria bacterium]
MNNLGSMLESLVADDPRRSADRLLSKMCEVAGAEGGAVLVPQGENANVFLSYRLSLAGLSSLPIRFQDHRARLAKGEVVSSPGFALAPITGDGDSKLGWVYLESPGSAEPKELRPFLLAMAKAVGALEASAGPRVATVNRVDANRAGIQRLLEENDWNIARVSRELGVTRRTLYMRLAAFGIARKKVPRLSKPLIA